MPWPLYGTVYIAIHLTFQFFMSGLCRCMENNTSTVHAWKISWRTSHNEILLVFEMCVFVIKCLICLLVVYLFFFFFLWWQQIVKKNVQHIPVCIKKCFVIKILDSLCQIKNSSVTNNFKIFCKNLWCELMLCCHLLVLNSMQFKMK